MIKSWTAENVEIAQRDVSEHALNILLTHSDARYCPKGTWATQKKNLHTLTEAYNTRRNVILFFSVNNSRAFQGYVSRILSCFQSHNSVISLFSTSGMSLLVVDTLLCIITTALRPIIRDYTGL